MFVVGAAAAGFLLGILVILPFAIRRRRASAAREEAAAEGAAAGVSGGDDEVVALEVIGDDDQPEPGDHFSVSRPAGATPPRPAMRGVERPPGGPESNIPMEWAHRHEGGPAPPGRVRGVCSGCGSKLTVSNRKPLRIACPVCGRTRLLT